MRLILGEDPESPVAAEESYRRRGELIRSWRREGILIADERPALYLYRLTATTPGGDPFSYTGVLGALRVAPWREGGVYPHEEVRPAVVEDRLRLLRATGVDAGVVQLVVDDPHGEFPALLESLPGTHLFTGTDWQGAHHSLTAIDDRAAIERLEAFLGPRIAVVADGHHRYTSFLEARGAEGLPGVERKLVVIGSLRDDGVRILPTHRLATWPAESGLAAPALAERLGAELDDEAGEEWFLEGEGGPLRRLASRAGPDEPLLAERLERALRAAGVSEWETPHDLGEARRRLRGAGGNALLAVLPAVSKSEFWRRAAAGEVFPPKTTYFQPKVASGVVARRIDGEQP